MKNKTIKIAIIGRTNAGKSTFINSLIGEKISIENKKINTTRELTAGIINISNTQIIFYDTPGFIFSKKNINVFDNLNNKGEFLDIIPNVNFVLFLIDVNKFNFNDISKDLQILKKFNENLIVVFNKIDKVKKELILSYIDKLNSLKVIKDFFNISAKYNKGITQFKKYLINKAKIGNWVYSPNVITDKGDIFISNECTRNAILKYLHKEIPYNINIKNKLFKILNNKNIKIKQLIEIKNSRYKSIILGKNGENIKRIRESSQKSIENILNSKIHLYLEITHVNAK